MQDAFCRDLVKAAHEMDKLREEIAACRECRHVDGNPAPGTGYPRADLFFIVSGPDGTDISNNDTLSSEISRALYSIATALGWNPTYIYRTYAVKCGVRHDIEDGECVRRCAGWLKLEIYIARPKWIIVFGGEAAEAVRFALDCGDDAWRAGSVVVRTPETSLVVTHNLSEAYKNKDAKLEVWRHLQPVKVSSSN